MKFKIDLPIASNPLLDYSIPVLTVGSCFADRMADKLAESGFDVCNNPFGILYNPISIVRQLGVKTSQNALIEHDGMWHSFQHHGIFSSVDRDTVIRSIKASSLKVQERLNQPKASVLVTFGSANVFTFKGEIVANCHKLPGNLFEKRRLAIEEIVKEWTTLLERYSQHDFLFTVSPVRYTREGMYKNNVSKAILHLAVSQLVKHNANANYFPAYEIVIDELRDYRFYEEDLVHPNNLAVDYVWSTLKTSLFTDRTKTMVKDWEEARQMQAHRLLHPDSLEAQKFKEKLSRKMAAFKQKYNGVVRGM